jgi:hypothetical protein
MYFQRVALDYIGNPLSGLFGAVGIKLDSIAKHICPLRDRLECRTVADTWIERCCAAIGKRKESANSLRFG